MVKKVIAGLAVAALVVAVGGQTALATNNNRNDWVKLTIEKEWVVASDPDGLFDEDDVDVSFDVKVFRDWQFKYSKSIDAGDSVWVKQGSFVVIEEDVEDLDDECDYTADNLKKYVKWGEKYQTHTVTNTVTCDEEDDEDEPAEEPKEEEEKPAPEKKDDGVVLSASTTTPPASLPKTGGNSAAIVAIVSASAAALLVASAAARRVFLKI